MQVERTCAKETLTPLINKMDNTLNIVIGIRQRLTDEQKAEIKSRYDEIRFSDETNERAGTGSVTVVTQTPTVSQKALDHAMGCNRFVLSSLLGSNDRHPLGMLLQWERALGIKLVDKKTLQDSFKGYLVSNSIN